MSDTPQRRTLRHALEALGGETALASVLHVGLADLRSWLAGESDVPAKAFFAALDIVTRADRAARWVRAAAEQPRGAAGNGLADEPRADERVAVCRGRAA